MISSLGFGSNKNNFIFFQNAYIYLLKLAISINSLVHDAKGTFKNYYF